MSEQEVKALQAAVTATRALIEEPRQPAPEPEPPEPE